MSEVRFRAGRIRGTVFRETANIVAGQVARSETTDFCRKLMNQATINAPVDTGFLRGQHSMSVAMLATKARGVVVNRAKYAEAVHEGTAAHTIVPRRGRVLRFKVGGRWMYARSVRHPGTRPRRWLRDAAEQTASREGWRFTRTVVSN